MSLQITGLIAHFRADGVDIGLAPGEAKAKPVIFRADIVAKQHRRGVVDGDKYVDRAVVVEIAQRHATRGEWLRENRAALRADVFKAVAGVVEQKHRLEIFHGGGALVDAVVGMAVAEQQIEVAVVVVVEKFQSPAAHQARGGTDAGRHGGIGKSFVLVVVVDRIHLLVDVGDEEIDPAVLIVVGSVNAHAGARAAETAVANACKQADFLEFSVAAIGEKKIGDRVVANEKIHASIVVDISGNDAPGLRERTGDAGLLANVGERAVAIIVIEPARHRIVDAGDAIPTLVRLQVAAEFVLGFVEVDEAADKEIEAAVVVVVEPDGAGAPAAGGDAGFGGDVGESTVAVVVIEDARGVLRHVNIRKAVAIVVANGDAHAVGVATDAGFLCDVSKCAVAIVFVERVAQRRIRIEEVALAAIDEINVHPAVVVVV